MKRIILPLLLIICTAYIQAQKNEITLEDIWLKGTFKATHITGINSMRDGKTCTVLSSDGSDGSMIEKYDYKSGKMLERIVSTMDLRKIPGAEEITIDDYKFSDDESKLLIYSNQEDIFRHSTQENYFVWDRKLKKLTQIAAGAKKMYGCFSPNGSLVAYVRDNNIYYTNVNTGVETAVTFDGKLNYIINGNPDWVYQEEFGFTQAFFWNVDGSKIAFMKFDESKVKAYSFPEYDANMYPKNYIYKYPKAGEENSVVSVHVFDLASSKITMIDVGSEKDQYIPRIKWTQDLNLLSIERLNRHQNRLELLFADASSGKSKVVLIEESKTYLDIMDDLYFTKDKAHFIWSSTRSGYNHIYLYKTDGSLEKQLTKGDWEVVRTYGYDEKSKTLFCQSAQPTPMDRQLHAIKDDGKDVLLSSEKGFTDAYFSASYDYFIREFSDVKTPLVYTLCTSEGKQVRVLEDNKSLVDKLKGYSFSPKEFFTFKTSEGIVLNGWMIKPENFDPTKKYPVMQFVYGGPGIQALNTQTVLNKWEGKDYFWHEMLAQKGIIVVSVDNRGSQYRGEAFTKSNFKQLGKVESTDQIETAKYLGTLPYIDPKRIGVEGWSFGGYMSSLLMTKGADYFKAGIAVAPVTHWKFYDNIFTERYLQLPSENQDGYNDNAPLNFADKLKGKFLLVHGSADDNVHYQNSVEFSRALIKANKQFDMFVYPDKNHSINGGNTRYHLYTKMTRFLLDNL